MSIADGTTLEDPIEDGTVLYEARRGVAWPAEVHIIDQAGGLLASYAEFEAFAAPD